MTLELSRELPALK